MRILLRIAATAVAIWIITLLPLDVEVTGGSEEWWRRALVYLGVAVILVLVNALVKPIVRFLTFPLRLLTLGLFALVINWAMLWLTSWITEEFIDFATLEVGGFWQTLLAAFIISVLTVVLTAAAPKRERK